MSEHTVEELLAEIADSAAREADVRNRAEIAEAKSRQRAVAINHLLEEFEDMMRGSDNEDEARAALSDENVNPEVYRVEDGHTFEVSPWPSMEGKCHLCGHPETMHMQKETQ